MQSTAPASSSERVRNIQKKKKAKKRGKVFIVLACVLAIFVGLYFFVVYTQLPFVKNLRDIYIETAMQTMSHHWLAELIFPDDVIAEVMDKVNSATDAQVGIESNWNHLFDKKDARDFYELFDEIDRPSLEAYLEEHPEYAKKSLMELDINEAGLDDKGTTIKTKQGDQVLAVNASRAYQGQRLHGSACDTQGRIKNALPRRRSYRQLRRAA